MMMMIANVPRFKQICANAFDMSQGEIVRGVRMSLVRGFPAFINTQQSQLHNRKVMQDSYNCPKSLN